MLRNIRQRITSHLHGPSSATIISLVALFVALGGTTYAAVNLPANSVGTKQIKNGAVAEAKLKNNAVTSAKVKDYSLLAKDFKRGQIPAGPQGAQGVQGPPGPFPDPVQHGMTLRGLWGHTWTATAAGQSDFLFYSYGGFRLASAPTPHYIAAGQAAPDGCTGGTFADPRADPGNLCVYEFDRHNASSQPKVCSIDTCPGSEDKGFQVAVTSAGAGDVWARGSWAVTAP